ncbi:cytochrome c oxidase, subunit VIa [Neurospora tetraspora]|uniref:Cytochrome c oxidase subunit 13, mitochondrial n=1 Tax=Neurospora tetraspora TaxID=94610 RepID=A0AAE0JMV8_9PEZI|nr:cytochrome c oxidase, subunit VIa [Neurospora tetraspora]
MFAQRQMFFARLAANLRAPAVRQTVQRRFASTPATDSGKNAFVRERENVKKHAAETMELWRKISLYGIPPALALAGYNAYTLYNEHWEHWSHLPPLEERTEYPYQNIRTRNYPWGDGDKTLFWNESVNYHNRDKVT